MEDLRRRINFFRRVAKPVVFFLRSLIIGGWEEDALEGPPLAAIACIWAVVCRWWWLSIIDAEEDVPGCMVGEHEEGFWLVVLLEDTVAPIVGRCGCTRRLLLALGIRDVLLARWWCSFCVLVCVAEHEWQGEDSGDKDDDDDSGEGQQ